MTDGNLTERVSTADPDDAVAEPRNINFPSPAAKSPAGPSRIIEWWNAGWR
jgi:hypothetical protein